MALKIHLVIFLILSTSLIFIIVGPLDYLRFIGVFIHFWVSYIYGFFILIYFSKNKKDKKNRAIVSLVITPIIAILSNFAYSIGTENDVDVLKVPKSNLIVTTRFYSLFMMGDPRCDISIGHPILGSVFIWKNNTYTKYGEGETDKFLSKYTLPKKIANDTYGVFILTKENYLFDMKSNKIYQTDLKNKKLEN